MQLALLVYVQVCHTAEVWQVTTQSVPLTLEIQQAYCILQHIETVCHLLRDCIILLSDEKLMKSCGILNDNVCKNILFYMKYVCMYIQRQHKT